MKKINIRFEPDATLDGIDILIRASERDPQINSVIESLTQSAQSTLTALDNKNHR